MRPVAPLGRPLFQHIDPRHAAIDLEQADRGVITPEALVTVSNFKGAEPLKAALSDLYKAQATLRTQRQFYTSDYKPMKDLEAQVSALDVAPSGGHRTGIDHLAFGIAGGGRYPEAEFRRIGLVGLEQKPRYLGGLAETQR